MLDFLSQEEIMNRVKLLGAVLVAVFCLPSQVLAGDFDGSMPLLCASTEVIECIPVEGCDRVTPEAANLPRFLKINFEDKTISAPSGSQKGRSTAIERMEHIDGKLIIQGAEDGVEGVRDGMGWTMAINEESGDMVLTASGDKAGFVVFGACTPAK